MTASCGFVLVACLLLAMSARAQDSAQPRLAIPDVVYKGIVGKALDAVPMDPEKRVALQRTNAVVSNTFTGRSLATWAGLSNPFLLVAGVAWGIYSAINIKAVPINAKPDAVRVEPGPMQIARVTGPAAVIDPETAQCSPGAITTEPVVVTDADSDGTPPTWERVAVSPGAADMTSARF
jgi:hypothetical protein